MTGDGQGEDGRQHGHRKVLMNRDQAFRSSRSRMRRSSLVTAREGGEADMQANRSALRAAGAAVIALGLLAAACSSTQSAQNASNKQAHSGVPATHTAATRGCSPNIDPSNFVKKIDNPLFPLKPGTKYDLRSKTT